MRDEEKDKLWREKHRDELREYNRCWRDVNRERVRAIDKKSRLKNRKKRKAAVLAWRRKNKEHVNMQNRKAYARNAEELRPILRERQKKWRLNNPEKYAKVKKRAYTRWQKRFKSDAVFREKEIERIQAWRATHPEYNKTIWLKYQYGITEKEWLDKIASQGGVCAICRKVPKRWHVDHNHISGSVRGILCGPCNQGIGQFKDDPILLRTAADYLETHIS